MKKNISLLFAMVVFAAFFIGMTAVAFAGTAEDEVTVQFRAVEAESFVSFSDELTVQGDLAEKTFPEIAEFEPGGVSCLDALIADHIRKYGIDQFNDYLSIVVKGTYEDAYVWVDKAYGQNLINFINGKEYVTSSAVIKDEDIITTLLYDDNDFSKTFSCFDKSDYTVTAGKPLSVEIVSKYYENDYPVDSATIALVDKDNGEITPLETVFEDGKATVVFLDAGEYLITAIGKVTYSFIGNTVTTDYMGAVANVTALEPSYAEIEQGASGSTTSYSYDTETKTLTFSGTGWIDPELYSGWYKYGSTAEHLVIEEGITSIGSRAFSDFRLLESVEFPESLREIEEEAFMQCYNLRNVYLPSGIREILESAFSSCISLVSINIPENLKTIEYHVFQGCESLEEITIPDSVEEIDQWAFANCHSLKKLIIGRNVCIIGTKAFYRCDALSYVIIPKNASAIYADAFAFCNPNVIFDTPTNSKAYYIAKYNDYSINHDFDDWIITKEAVGFIPGLKERTCRNCGELECEEIPAPDSKTIQQQIDDLNNTLGDLISTISGLEKKIQSAQNAINELEADSENADNSLALKIEAIIEQINALEKKIESTEEEKNQIEQKLNEYLNLLEKAEKYSVPPFPLIKRVIGGKKKLTVTWVKPSKKVTGYNVQYSTKKNFSSGFMIKTIKGYNKSKVTIKKLKSKTKYYVRIRTYKTIDGKKYYSDWSKKKTVKVKA